MTENKFEICWRCEGRGYEYPYFGLPQKENCSLCNGKGIIDTQKIEPLES